jgi:GH25 family lysozyme M1 (1,4-beta-N-acetylmuramidase)
MKDPCVIDLSHHNPTPNWATLKANGVVGIIHKATEGTGFVDDQLFKRAKAAMDAGLLWSTYHFLRPGSMQAQMAFYLNTVNPVEGERVVLDHEDAGVSIPDLEDAVEILLDDPRNLQVTIYSGHVIEEQLGSTQNTLLGSSTSLWTAEYTTKATPTWPKATWPAWSLWQYSDKVTVPGIPAPIDGNRWNGDEASLRAWFGPTSAIVPQPEPIPEPAVVEMTWPPGVRLIVNGREVEVEPA